MDVYKNNIDGKENLLENSQENQQLKQQLNQQLNQKESFKQNQQEDYQENQDESLEPQERVEDVVLEAKYVAKKIKELIDSNYIVYDRKKGYRKITYKDIVVLLRSTKISAPIFEKEISNLIVKEMESSGMLRITTTSDFVRSGR